MLKNCEVLKSIININTTKNKSINCLNVTNTEGTNSFVKSSSFNEFFTTISKKIESNVVHTHKSFTHYITNPSKKTLFLTPALPDEVEDITKTLNLRKSIGPDITPTTLLKKYSKTISILISKLKEKKQLFVFKFIYGALLSHFSTKKLQNKIERIKEMCLRVVLNTYLSNDSG